MTNVLPTNREDFGKRINIPLKWFEVLFQLQIAAKLPRNVSKQGKFVERLFVMSLVLFVLRQRRIRKINAISKEKKRYNCTMKIRCDETLITKHVIKVVKRFEFSGRRRIFVEDIVTRRTPITYVPRWNKRRNRRERKSLKSSSTERARSR